MTERLFPFLEKEKNRRIRLIPVQVVLALVISACSSQPTEALKTLNPTQAPNRTQTASPARTGIELGFPLSDDLWVINGPHYIGDDRSITSAIDVASSEGIPCKPGDKKSINDVKVVAPQPATVTTAGGKDKNDRTDTEHSIVRLKLDNGYALEMVHLDNIEVVVGQRLRIGQPIGEMSCEVPAPYEKNGKRIEPTTDVIHLHEGLEKDGEPVSIIGSALSGLEIKEDGTMKNVDRYAVLNYTVTPNPNRCGPSKESIAACNGVINFIPNPKNAKPGVVR